MNEYNVSDYGIFTNGIATVGNFNNSIETGKAAVAEAKTTLSNEAVFKGPACDSCLEGIANTESKLGTMTTNFTTIADFLKTSSTNYQSGDQNASNTVLNIGNDGAVTTGNANTGNANRDQIYNYLAAKGYNKAAIIGILSNIRSESNYKTDALGDGGTSYGICQWHNSRWTDLKNYCSQNGKNPNTMEGQLDFLMYELESKYPKLNDTLKNVSNNPEGAYKAAYEWTVKFERPAGMETSGNNRGNHAKNQLWQEYQNV